MKFLQRKRAAKRKPQAPPPVSHRLTRDLARSEQLAEMVAKSRSANLIEVADMLVGMYLYDWERLSRYWKEPERVETFLQRICGISPQRFHFWIANYDRKRHLGDFNGKKMPARRKFDPPPGGPAPARSLELQGVLRKAEEIAPHHDRLNARAIPILTCECVLLCIAREPESEIAHRLVASGLDLLRLEREARFPRHAPQ
jgi:hypothetical protein